MHASLAFIVEKVARAKRPEDLFGELTGTKTEQEQAGRRIFHRLSRSAHPDCHLGDSAAEAAYSRISELWQQALVAIRAGVYGQPAAPSGPVIRTKRHTYADLVPIAAGDIADVYACDYEDGRALLKVARQADDSDLIQTETAVLRHLRQVDRPAGADFLPFLPEPIETFRFREAGTGRNRTATAFVAPDGFVSLEEVKRLVPAGIHPKDMAWMWRRLLHILGYVHAREVIHGAILPSHVLIHPEGHGLILVDWCYAVREPIATSTHIPAISLPYEAWYPAEVMAKEPPRPGTDILMGARCMTALLGGDPVTGALPAAVPAPMRAFFANARFGPSSFLPDDLRS
jgi:hypothetical protein